VKKKKKPPVPTPPPSVLPERQELHCIHCEDGHRVPDTFTFRVITELFIECWYCKQWLEHAAASRLLNVTIRSQAMAQKANKPS